MSTMMKSKNDYFKCVTPKEFLKDIKAPRLGFSPISQTASQDLNPDVLADRKVSISRSTRSSNRGMKRFIYM